MPFLSIVTRHITKRVHLFSRCQKSILDQTDTDYEHIVLEDSIGIGIEKANQMLFLNRNVVHGDYVFIMDDDIWLIENTFVEEMKQLVGKNNPDVIIIQTVRPSGISPKVWGQAVRGEIDTACAVVKVNLWKKMIHMFMPYPGGDGIFIKSVLRQALNPYWHKKIYSKTDKSRFGGV